MKRMNDEESETKLKTKPLFSTESQLGQQRVSMPGSLRE